MGALVPIIVIKWVRSKCVDEVLGLLGASFILIGVTCYREDFHIPGFYAVFPAIGAGALLLSGSGRPTTISKILSWSPAVYIGRISYSLYLLHWPLNVFAGHLIENYSPLWRLAMFALSIVLAALVYHVVEDPIRRKRNLVTNNKLLLGYVVGLAATVSIFAVALISDGLPRRFPDEVVRLANYVNDKTEPLEECDFAGQPINSQTSFCQIGIADGNPTWLIYGDSHAWAAHAAFDKWLKLNSQAGLFIFRHSCPPLKGVHLFGDKDECFAFNREVTHFIESNTYLRNIVLVSTWRQAIEGRLSISSQILATKEEFCAAIHGLVFANT